MEIQLIAPPRGEDSWGSGRFGAPRGSRLHMGVDYAAYPGSRLLSPVYGFVSKLGYPYSDDLTYRYVQVSVDGIHHRFFYVDPGEYVAIGDEVYKGDVLGTVQDITRRYPVPKGMKPHLHHEVKDDHGNFLTPRDYA